MLLAAFSQLTAHHSIPNYVQMQRRKDQQVDKHSWEILQPPEQWPILYVVRLARGLCSR